MKASYLLTFLALAAACTSPKETLSAESVPTAEAIPARPAPDTSGLAALRAQGVEFAASGTAPAWRLTGRADQGWLLQLPGEPTARLLPLTLPRQSADTLMYAAATEAGPLAIALVASGCEDAATGEKTTHTVLVRTAAARYQGCGRFLRPAGPLALHGRRWTLATVAGRLVPAAGARGPAQIQFDVKQGRYNGFTGCNRFMANFVRQETQLALKPAAVTRMACPGAPAGLESAYLRQLPLVQAYALRPDGLHLLHGDSTVLRFR